MTGRQWLAALADATALLKRTADTADAVTDLDPIARASLRQSAHVAHDVLTLAQRRNAPAIREAGGSPP